jgi:hypothetical protein
MPEVVLDWDPVVIRCLLVFMVGSLVMKRKGESVSDFVLLIIFMLLLLVVAE